MVVRSSDGCNRALLRRPVGLALAIGLALAAPGVAAQELVPGERPRLEIPYVEDPPRLEEFLDMRPPARLSGGLAQAAGFTQRDPEDGQPASQHTEVYLTYDQEHIYAVFLAFDDEPEKIRARLGRRENLFGDEIVEIQFDTFADQRRAFTFIANPFGIQWDAIWTEGQGFDASWDTVWHSEGRLTDEGYVVLMRIPFRSLRFPQRDEQSWGLVLVRDIPRNNESSFWPRVSNRIEGRLNQAATLTGLRGISPGRNIWMIPYATARSFELLDQTTAGFVSDDFDGDAGLDAKFVLQDSLALDVTLNPDFSQVESDVPQVTVNQRFEVFFPERRPFFLENANYFETPINLLFTRRIAEPSVGARLTGKLGNWAVGTLFIDDEAAGKRLDAGQAGFGERAWFQVLRMSRDVGRQSNVGFFYTGRDFAGGSNRVASLDGRFKLGTNWVSQAQVAYSRTVPADADEPTTEDPAFDVIVNREGRKATAHLHYRDIGPEFETESGFVNRRDIRDLHGRGRYTFRPEGKRLVAWGPTLFLQQIRDHQGQRLDWTILPTLSWDFRGQTSVSAEWIESRERLRPEDFDALAEPRDFSTNRLQLRFSTASAKSVTVNARVVLGEGINFVPPDGEEPRSADQQQATLEFTLRPGRRTRIDTTYLWTRLDDQASGERVFSNQIFRTRLNWQYNPKISVRAIVQYDILDPGAPEQTSLERDERVNFDLLLTYLANPWTAVYVGYNSNLANVALVPGEGGEVVPTENDLLNDSRQFFVKLSYLLRF